MQTQNYIPKHIMIKKRKHFSIDLTNTLASSKSLNYMCVTFLKKTGVVLPYVFISACLSPTLLPSLSINAFWCLQTPTLRLSLTHTLYVETSSICDQWTTNNYSIVCIVFYTGISHFYVQLHWQLSIFS